MFVGAEGWPGGWLLLTTMTGLALACGGSSALNHVMDADIETVRKREVLDGRARRLGSRAARARQGGGPGNGECSQYSHQHPGPEAASGRNGHVHAS